MICERCGNEFYKKIVVKVEDSDRYLCPFCKYYNEKFYSDKKKRKKKR